MEFMYTLAFLLSFGLLVCFVIFFSKIVSVFYALAYGAVVITNLGFLHLVCSDGLRTALFANQTLYIGACFVPFFFLMCVADLCKVTIPRKIQVFCGCVSGLILILVSSVGVFDLYYKNVEYIVKDGYGVLVKEYGPLHMLYPAYLILSFSLAVFCVIKAMRSKKEVPFSTSVLLILAMALSMMGYFVRRLFGIDMEIMPFLYDLTLILMLILLTRISLLNIADVTSNSMFESDDNGFIVLDMDRKYLGSDAAAKHWFPQIEETHVGEKLMLGQEEMDCFIEELLLNPQKEATGLVKVNDYYLEIVGSFIKRKFLKSVYCLYLRDDTVQQKLNQLNIQYQENLKQDVEEKTEKIRNIQEDIVISMASIVENRDNNTGGHIARTSDIVKIFVKYLKTKADIPGLTDTLAKNITKAAPLHDFGKIAIPDSILNKPGRFEPEEYEIMKTHSAKGADIVARILMNSDDEAFRQIAVHVAHYHHERWDGKGYPDGLKENEIPFEARVMALADVFDALVSKRVYKERMSYEKAFSIIEEGCGSQFDPVLGKLFLECREQLIELYESSDD